MLEPHHEVVGEAHDDHVAARVPPPPLVGPQVKDVVQVDVREQRRNRCPLRTSLLGRRPRPVLDDPRGQPFLDQPQDPLVRDPVLEELHQPSMVEAGEVVADIRVEHPVHLLAARSRPRAHPTRHAAAPRPEPVGETEEVRLVDGVQHLDHRPLEDLVLQRGDPERPQPPVRLRDVHPPRRPRPVRAPLNPSVEIPKVVLQVQPVVLPRHPVHPRRGLRAERPSTPPAGDRRRRGAGAR